MRTSSLSSSLISLISALSLLSIGLGGAGCVIVSGGTSDSESKTSSSSSSGSSGSMGSSGSSEATSEGSGSATEGMSSSGEATTAATGTDTTDGSTGVETTGGASCEDGCAEDEYCDWGSNSCGTLPTDEGTCLPRPEACDANYEPVCGCDGAPHSNECGAYAEGVDIAGDGGCAPIDEYFACGWRYCQEGSEYCQVAYNDVDGPDFFSCKPLPEACSKELVCGCLEGEPCADYECTDDDGLTVYCPAASQGAAFSIVRSMRQSPKRALPGWNVLMSTKELWPQALGARR